ncbi:MULTISPECIES: hypothetical protein [unclassified Exiguobacterium]|uniref:hypothetical protein n=1 Tax=unclassified Exiguobacterium TaxID=2644629 RepID=UPI001BEBFDEE|nr:MULTISPECIES: hypothetical protein [unclassified Exiguobacterium]
MLDSIAGIIESMKSILTKRYELMVVIVSVTGIALCYQVWENNPFESIWYDNLLMMCIVVISMIFIFYFSKKASLETRADEQRQSVQQAIEKAGEMMVEWGTNPLLEGDIPVSEGVSIFIKRTKKGRTAQLRINGVLQPEKVRISGE